jgi:hypothetical protein
MLVRYCGAHVEHFGYPRLLGVRWNGWTISSAGGLCEACRERDRDRWETAPYGAVLIPAPVELVPRTLVRRVIVATLAAAAAAVVTTAALLVAQPPDLIPSGGEPGSFSSGARVAGSPSAAQADTDAGEPAASRPTRAVRAVPRVAASRAAHRSRRVAFATPVGLAGACAGPVLSAPAGGAAAHAPLAHRASAVQSP